MGRCVEGDLGGIAALRLLIEGEYAGAINTDLRRAGMPGVEWAGTLRLSWWELSEFISDLRTNHRSSLFRRLHPDDYHLLDPQVQMATEAANILADLRMFTVMDRLGPDTPMPEQYLLRYGRPEADDDPGEVDDGRAAGAREVAAGIRG